MNDAKKDLFAILDAVPAGCDVLRAAAVEGRILGVLPDFWEHGHIGCVKAHIAHAVEDPPKIALPSRGYASMSPIEKFSNGIAQGMKPGNDSRVKQLVAWLDEWKSGEEEFVLEEEFTL